MSFILGYINLPKLEIIGNVSELVVRLDQN